MNPQPTDATGEATPETTTGDRPRTVPAATEGGAPSTRSRPASDERQVTLRDLSAYYGDHRAVKDVNVSFASGEVTAIIGPSGCGKSTMVRCINRMHEEIDGAHAEGQVLVDGTDLYGPGVDVVAVRRAVGMVFQRPNPFPTMSIYDNVAAGLRFTRAPRAEIDGKVTEALRGASLWDEVKDRLDKPGAGLSGGQQQRLCIARALAVEPEVLLMDEPCSALDPVATLKIEELIGQLKERVTIVIVTHNMQQAARVADTTVFMLDGELVEVGQTQKLFTTPEDERTEQYVSGKFG
ncbi:MAG: phosphate ABC transporter ATP-binding protein [Actinobacteria bacterium]|nr:phosphate ABC transporter ATP-binding protein [Actinomycetota bacterium]